MKSVVRMKESQRPSRNWNLERIILIALPLLLSTALLSGEFIWDDRAVVLEDLAVTGESNISSLVLSPYGPEIGGSQSGYWRPVTSLSFRMNYILFGESSLSFRTINTLLHVTVVLLFYLLILRIGAGPKVAFMASLLFSVHPVMGGSLSWAVGRTDILALLGMLAALLMYLRYEATKTRMYLAAFTLFILFALGGKEIAVVFPALLLLVQLHRNDWQVRNFRERDTWIPLILATAVVIAFLPLHSYIVSNDYGQLQEVTTLSFAQLLGNLSGYIKTLFVPLGLDYFSFSADSIVANPLAALPLAVFLGVLILAAVLRIQTLLFGLLWALLFIVPVIGIIPLRSEYLRADHLLYGAIPGACFVISIGVMRLASASRMRYSMSYTGTVALVILTLLFATGFLQSASIWKSETRLFSRLAPASKSAHMQALYGDALLRDKRAPEAAQAYEQGRSIDNSEWTNWYGLAQIEISRENYSTAKSLLNATARLNPMHSATQNNLGNIYFLERDFSKAAQVYQRAVQLDPKNYEALFNLGNVHFASGKHAEATGYFERFLRTAPSTFDEQKQRVREMLR
jgi:protein O-mannosyl-transferase